MPTVISSHVKDMISSHVTDIKFSTLEKTWYLIDIYIINEVTQHRRMQAKHILVAREFLIL